MLITLEGGDGAGKSTQARLLVQRIRDAGWRVVLIREPGGTQYGEDVRTLLLHHALTEDGERFPLSPVAEMLLFASARAQLVDEIIRPALERGKIVVCDRFADSMIAYQAYGRGIPLDDVQNVNAIAVRGVVPDLTILLDIPPAVGLARRSTRHLPIEQMDEFEREAHAFHERVRRGYLELAKESPSRWLVIDGRLPPGEIANTIWDTVEPRLCREVAQSPCTV